MTEAAPDWTADDLRPYLDVALEAFTPRRLMFGSDWPMCLLATTYGEWLATAHAWADQLSMPEHIIAEFVFDDEWILRPVGSAKAVHPAHPGQ